jgi:hypothetical protein
VSTDGRLVNGPKAEGRTASVEVDRSTVCGMRIGKDGNKEWNKRKEGKFRTRQIKLRNVH